MAAFRQLQEADRVEVITSTATHAFFPLMDRNPQVFMDIYQARDGDFQPAVHRIHHEAPLPSYLELPMLEP